MMPPGLARLIIRKATNLIQSENWVLGWLPTWLCLLGCPLGSYLGGYVVAAMSVKSFGWEEEMFGCILGMGAGGLVGGFLGRQIQFPRLRSCIRQVIND